MKEATGELNMTVVTVVAIAAIAALFAVFVLPNIKENITNKSKCSSAICPPTCTNNKRVCQYYKGNSVTNVEYVVCPC